MSLEVADPPLSPPLSPLSLQPSSPVRVRPAKRPREAASGGGARGRENRSVRFSHIDIRMHGVEMWGGGGVPGDDGPPLGLSWHVEGERRVDLEEYEMQRLSSRRPKETYCTVGCVEPQERTQILMHHGSTPRQINTIKKEVAKLNRERWQVKCVQERARRAPARARRGGPALSSREGVIDTPARTLALASTPLAPRRAPLAHARRG